MRIRRIIIQLLILNILLSNFAWAVDDCAYLFDAPAQQNSSADNSSNDSAGDNSQNISCDSHCFANARLLYVSFTLPEIIFMDVQAVILYSSSNYHSVTGDTPGKPPKV